MRPCLNKQQNTKPKPKTKQKAQKDFIQVDTGIPPQVWRQPKRLWKVSVECDVFVVEIDSAI